MQYLNEYNDVFINPQHVSSFKIYTNKHLYELQLNMKNNQVLLFAFIQKQTMYDIIYRLLN